MFILVERKDELYNRKIIECSELKRDIIFEKYSINENEIIKLQENQNIILFEKGKILDVKKSEGYYEIKNIDGENEKLDKEWKELYIRNSENENLCVVFINLNVISNNRYRMNGKIKYVDENIKETKKKHIKIEAIYDFKIINPVKLFSKVVGLRNHFMKQELVEKIRGLILNSVENGIHNSCKEYKLDIENLAKSSLLEIKTNDYDLKLLEYGVEITNFKITDFEIINKKFNFF